MHFMQIVVLAIIQGLAELLPVSSSAHVILAEKLMGMDPTTPELTLLLVMLHTGTMAAVIAYFWKDWNNHYFRSPSETKAFLVQILLATVSTLVIGFCLKVVIEKIIMKETPNAEVEMLFGNLTLISLSLACAGLLILFSAGRKDSPGGNQKLAPTQSIRIGLIQGLCLPFRGFSRSGATISVGLLLGLAKTKAEEFSFALAVVLTPFALGKEVWRLLKSHVFSGYTSSQVLGLFVPELLGAVFSFCAGLLALRWLSNWLTEGRWGWFGIYCLVASAIVWLLR